MKLVSGVIPKGNSARPKCFRYNANLASLLACLWSCQTRIELLHATLRLDQIIFPARIVVDDGRLDEDYQFALLKQAVARSPEQQAQTRRGRPRQTVRI